MSKLKEKLTLFLPILITITIFTVLFLKIDINLFLENLKQVSILKIIIALLFLSIPFIIISYRWKIMISDYKEIDMKTSARAVLASQSFNMITPARIGELSKIFFLKDKKFNLKIGTGAMMLEKFLDLFSIILISLIGLSFIKTSQEFQIFLFSTLIAFVICLIILFNIRSDKKSIVVKIINKLIPFKKLRDRILVSLSYFQEIKKNKQRLTYIIFLSILLWTSHLFQSYLFFWAMGYEIDFLVAIGLIPIGIIIGLIPISFAGMGTRDTAFIFLFKDYAPASTMVLFGLLFSLRYLVPALIGLIFLKGLMSKKK